MDRLKHKTALITGAARGIGAAIARLFIAEGATVLLTDIDDEAGANLAHELGCNAHYRHLDVSDEAKWQTLSTFIKQNFKGLDIVVNNAGIIGLHGEAPQDPEHCTLSNWRQVHAVNNDGVFLGCKYAIALMKDQSNAAIVNLSSRSGIVGIPSACAYAASKAAVRNHTKSVALYCAEKKYAIRCNSIHPAAILTPMWDAMLGYDPLMREKKLAALANGIPLKHLGKPEDVAYAVLYLASDESLYVTGSELTIDGGILAGSQAVPSDE